MKYVSYAWNAAQWTVYATARSARDADRADPGHQIRCRNGTLGRLCRYLLQLMVVSTFVIATFLTGCAPTYVPQPTPQVVSQLPS
jgi:hypothetical protein